MGECDPGLLSRVALFSDLPARDIAAIARHGRTVRCAAGESVLHQDDLTRDVFFVAEGRVRITSYAVSGREVSYRDLGAGQMFGELAAIDGRARSAGVVALEETLLVRLSDGIFETLLVCHPEAARALMRWLVAMVRDLSERVFEFSTLSVRARLQAELLRLARAGVPRGERIVVARVQTHAELASRLSTHREAISREMSALARAGIIERVGETLVIHDVERLASLLADTRGD